MLKVYVSKKKDLTMTLITKDLNVPFYGYAMFSNGLEIEDGTLQDLIDAFDNGGNDIETISPYGVKHEEDCNWAGVPVTNAAEAQAWLKANS